MSKLLVCYFSASGVTKKVAERISSVLDGDLFEIEPKVKYTFADLDWTNKESRSSIEMKDLSFRPEVDHKVDNLDDYDTVIIGFPVWWYTAPTIVRTFLEENAFNKQNIYIFVTSGGSGVDDILSKLKDEYPKLNFISGKRFTEDYSDDEIKQWINK